MFDAAGRVLLVEHVFRRTYPWGLPAGWVNPRETVEQALVREIREETGLDGEVEHLLGVESGFRMRTSVVLMGRCSGQPQNRSLETISVPSSTRKSSRRACSRPNRVHIDRAVSVRLSGLHAAGGPWLDSASGNKHA